MLQFLYVIAPPSRTGTSLRTRRPSARGDPVAHQRALPRVYPGVIRVRAGHGVVLRSSGGCPACAAAHGPADGGGGAAPEATTEEVDGAPRSRGVRGGPSAIRGRPARRAAIPSPIGTPGVHQCAAIPTMLRVGCCGQRAARCSATTSVVSAITYRPMRARPAKSVAETAARGGGHAARRGGARRCHGMPQGCNERADAAWRSGLRRHTSARSAARTGARRARSAHRRS